MELKYIWIRGYKNLKEIDFNFNNSSSEKFNYNKGILTIDKVKNKTPKAFFSSNISGITAIVGKNGSGKTNLTEFIHYNLSHVTNGGLSTWIKSHGLIVLGNNIFIQEEIPFLNVKEIEEIGYSVNRYENAPLDKNAEVLRWHRMEKNKYIYYNPVFDFRILPMGSGRENIQNISTSYLVWNDVYHSNVDKKESADLLMSHERLEKLREANCIINNSELINFLSPIPTELILTINVESENALTKILYFDEKDQEDPDKAVLEQLYKELRERRAYYRQWYVLDKYKIDKEGPGSIYLLPIELKKEYFKGLFWVNFFCVLLKISDRRFEEDFFRKFIFDLELKLEDSDFYNKLISLKSALNKFVENCNWQVKEKTIKDRNYFSWEEHNNSVFDLFRHVEYSMDSSGRIKLLQDLNKKTKELLNENLPFHYQFLNEYSSGQQKLLNFYSRFYWAREEISRNERGQYGVEGERVIILIDEGEVSLHPEWQRTFFKDSTDYLTKLFDNRDLQIIYITHSPFVLSDIPKGNVIFIDKDEEGDAIRKHDAMEKTFGANIYSLLSDSFFMENGTLGEFSKQKIKRALDVLDEEYSELSEEQIEEIDYIINCIGEPLIKMQLESMREKKISSSVVSAMRKRIEDLEERLRKEDDKD